MMQAPRPFVLSVHVQATERYRERMAQKRRYKRIHGVNRGVEQRGRPLDPDARVQEQEAAELNDELATSAGRGHLPREHLLRAAGARPRRGPGDAARSCARRPDERSRWPATRGSSTACSPRAALWQSTLPLGRDVAARRRKYVSRNVGDTFPLCGTELREPGRASRSATRSRAAPGAPGPVRSGAPEPSAADQRHERGGQDDGRDHPAWSARWRRARAGSSSTAPATSTSSAA